ncbi:thermostable alkaline protease precursor [Fusarium beomiforme]|uniref:Thermostable alkaline protease n=1 Tax=Fusarium beomiforme TaxID=44412 RepID=A0A9P5DVY6_9HYPO|nr:thermostable alkaline protease precursor [Fusarium beomiforme]
MAPDRFSACELVVKVAKEVYALVMECGIRQRQRLAGEVGTRLGQIAQESFVTYELDEEAEEAAARLLHSLLEICLFPTPVSDHVIPEQDYKRLVQLVRPENRARLNKAITLFFITDKALPFKVKEHCDAFLAKLSQDEPRKKTGLDQLTRGSTLTEPDDYPKHVSKNLFEALHKQAFCRQTEKPTQKSWLSKSKKGISHHHHEMPHPIRLHLDAVSQIQKKHAQFEVVISSENMSYWQHFLLGIPTQTKGRRGAVKFADDCGHEEETGKATLGLKCINPDYFCEVLKHQLFAKVNLNFVKGIGLVSIPPPAPLEIFLCPGQGLPLSLVIQTYKLTDKDKILLAHAIAHSFWQFFGSDLMRHRWTSDDIWFMHEMNERQIPKDQLALRVYMSVDFEQQQRTSDDEDRSMLTHPFPHILGLGLILLQIGLARPFKSLAHLPSTSRLNRDHGAARQLLGELERAQWARTTHRDIFARAVANCLDPSTFMTSNTKTKAIQISPITNTVMDDDGRRRKVYSEIVEPLAKLVKIAFKADANYVSYLARCKEAEESQNKLRSQVASFHTGKTVVPQEWLDNLKHISMHVMNLRDEKPDHEFKPVKIAILDTGCDADLPFCKIPRRKKCIRGWKDFTIQEIDDTTEAGSMDDEYGHGSLMTRLVMEAAPLAHVYVARVARNTNELDSSSDQIAQAIRWAGLEAEVDIISMSFGFPHDDDAISIAIEDVERSCNIIFVASSGNNAAYQREAFPARHRSARR